MGGERRGKSLGRAFPLAIEHRLICKVASSLDNGGRWEAKGGECLWGGLSLAIEQRLICKVASRLDNGGRWEAKGGEGLWGGHSRLQLSRGSFARWLQLR